MQSCALFVPALVAGLFAAPLAHAQLEWGGAPPSATLSLAPAPTFDVGPVTITPDMLDSAANKDGVLRFGEEVKVGIDPSLSAQPGRWDTLPNGARVWRLRVSSPGAYSLSFLFDRFALADGEELYVYNDARTDAHGSYTALNNKPNGQFAIQPVAGDAVTIERYVPAFVATPGPLRVSHVVHAFKDIMVTYAGVQTKAAGACEVDVNCPQGAGWTNQRNAVALIIAGGALCTGQLINNQPGAAKQYFITAYHCGSMTNAVFRFNYQRSGCSSGSAPTNNTVQGSTQLGANQNVDVRLVEITESIPANYGVYYLGYDKSGVAPSNTVCIHHPAGDVKKISFDNNAPTKSGTDWHVSQWDLGVTEPGSSGSCLLTPQGRFIGQLYGGASYCGFPYDDYYGRLDAAWTYVKTALDPNNTNQATVDGRDPNANCGSTLSYGAGCAGTWGAVPQQAASGCFKANGSGTFAITQGLNNSSAFVFMGTGQGSSPMPGGCSLLLSGLFPLPAGPIPLPGLFPGNGSASIPFTLPASIVGGTSIYLQTFVQDGGVARGFSNSAGLRINFN